MEQATKKKNEIIQVCIHIHIYITGSLGISHEHMPVYQRPRHIIDNHRPEFLLEALPNHEEL